jgi:hypothetical protein
MNQPIYVNIIYVYISQKNPN